MISMGYLLSSYVVVVVYGGQRSEFDFGEGASARGPIFEATTAFYKTSDSPSPDLKVE